MSASLSPPLYDNVCRGWQVLTHRSPQLMSQARIQVQWALRLVAAVGDDEADDGSATFAYDRLSHRIRGPRRKFGLLAVRPSDLRLSYIDGGGDEVDALDLVGQSLASAGQWVRQRVGSGAVVGDPIERKPERMRAHPLSKGSSFSLLQPSDHQELERWYDNAAVLLEALGEHYGATEPPNIHDRHTGFSGFSGFSIRFAIDERRHVTVGMSPGDAGVPEPHFFVIPSPEPAGFDVPSGDATARTAEGWSGTLLCASRLARPEADLQPRQVIAFAVAAIEGCLALLGEPVSPLPP